MPLTQRLLFTGVPQSGSQVQCGLPFPNGLDYSRSGRPRQTWLRTVESDVAPLNTGLATAYIEHKIDRMGVTRWNGDVRWTGHAMMMMCLMQMTVSLCPVLR